MHGVSTLERSAHAHAEQHEVGSILLEAIKSAGLAIHPRAETLAGHEARGMRRSGEISCRALLRSAVDESV